MAEASEEISAQDVVELVHRMLLDELYAPTHVNLKRESTRMWLLERSRNIAAALQDLTIK